MGVRQTDLSSWDLFVLRHHKPLNLMIHAISALLFFGSPLCGLFTGDWTWFLWWCLSGCIGTAAHYIARDGMVSLREGTSSPQVVGFNVRMWWRVFTGRYRGDIMGAKARLAEEQTQAERTVLITGASSGFGEATTRELLARGFWVIATVRRESDGARFADLSPSESARLTIVQLDLSVTEQREQVIARVKSRGRLDALICNAGYGVFGALEDLDEQDLRAQMEVNFFAAALLTRDLTSLLRASRGTLIHISSPAGVSGFPWTSAYCASKHALEGLTESLHYELSPYGVAVHIVTPSAHRTRFMANAKWVQPEHSAYRDPVAAYRSVMTSNQEKRLPSAVQVACVVAELTERRTVGLRIDVGSNVRVLRGMVRWLPGWLRHPMVIGAFRRATTKYKAESVRSTTHS
jgi:NAD(P)-dependent dehydrogenase (short-subunit alcohol dehydrogenase family)